MPGDTTNAGPAPGGGAFLSRNECAALVRRATGFASGGGRTTLFVESRWTANLRWARNQVTTSGDVRDDDVSVVRVIRGATGSSLTNQVDDAHVRATVRHAERMLEFSAENPEAQYQTTYREPYTDTPVWSDATYRQTAEERAELMRALIGPAARAGMLAAGYLQVSAHGRSSMESDTIWYYPYTQAQYSVTVRAPDGSGSGWAGVDHHDWAMIDARALSEVATEKCLRSRNPVRLEPGRYTAILEPQAVADLCAPLFTADPLDRELAENGDRQAVGESGPYRSRGGGKAPLTPFGRGNGYSKLGERVIDERLTVRTDPTEPECAFPPFDRWQVYHPATWITDGVLTDLAYVRGYAVKKLGKDTGGLATTGAFHIGVRGPMATIDDMITTTKRGVLVTRFSGVAVLDPVSVLLTGYTRDGLWLVEDGKISKAIKNFRFTDSPVFVLNNVEQVGVPKRVFHPGRGTTAGFSPIVVPALKVHDLSFTGLSDAI